MLFFGLHKKGFSCKSNQSNIANLANPTHKLTVETVVAAVKVHQILVAPVAEMALAEVAAFHYHLLPFHPLAVPFEAVGRAGTEAAEALERLAVVGAADSRDLVELQENEGLT